MIIKKYADIKSRCVACGTCLEVCPRNAISIWRGATAKISKELCIGCGRCVNECPAGQIILLERKKDEE